MISNYLKIAIRLFMRRKAFAFINIFGLTIGMIGFILIFLYVKYEISFNRHHKKIDRIYLVVRDSFFDNKVYNFTPTPYPFRDAIVAEYPEIEKATRLDEWTHLLFKYGGKTFEETVTMADKDVFDIFTFSILEGNAKDPLPSISSAAISKKIADKYFDGQSAIGKTFQINGKFDFNVTAVYDNFPPNSSMVFDVILPVEFYKDLGRDLTQWNSNAYNVYLLLKEGSDVAFFEKKLKPRLGQSQKRDKPDDLFLHPFKDYYLHNFKYEDGPIKYVYIFSIIGIVILALAGMNYVNLATARSVHRAKEIGIRKTVGAEKRQIVLQFLGESVLLTLVSVNFAVLIVELLLPLFNAVLQKRLAIDFANPMTLVTVVAMAVVVGVLAGAYPAFHLARFSPTQVLKSSATLKRGSFKSALVIVQFTVTIALIITSLVLTKQFSYLLKLPVGFDKERVLYFKLEDDTRNQFESLANELESVPNVVSVSAGGHLPTEIFSNGGGYQWEGKDPNQDVLIRSTHVHDAYAKTLGMQLVGGRFFEPGENVQDTVNRVLKIVVNERLVQITGFEDPIGKSLNTSDGGWRLEIIGVLKDFNFLRMSGPVGPLMLFYDPHDVQFGFIKVNGKLEEVRSGIIAKFSKIYPQYPANFQLLDDQIATYFGREARNAALFGYFTLMAILISCLGLYGLASFITEQRKKEMGIRKSLGATTSGILALMLKDFGIWILIANVIAIPLAWWYCEDWLSKYSFRTEISWWIFASAMVGSVLIAFATVLFQVLKTAKQNPAVVLKYE
jgi:putative ABC transport system permease protein